MNSQALILSFLLTLGVCCAKNTYEFGEVQVKHRWITVAFDASIEDPLVFANLPSHKGGDPALAQVRNVQKGQFEIRLREWREDPTGHTFEAVSYLVVSKGKGKLHCGLDYEAGSFMIETQCTTFNDLWHDLSFSDIGENVVMSQMQTLATPDSLLHTRQRGVTKTSAQFSMEFTEGQREDPVNKENVAWINIRIDAKSCIFEDTQCHIEAFRKEEVDHVWRTATAAGIPSTKKLLFGVGQIMTFRGSDTAWLRRRSEVFDKNTFQVQVEEEKSADTETQHPHKELTGFLVSTCRPKEACECFVYPMTCAKQTYAKKTTAGTCACILYSEDAETVNSSCEQDIPAP